MRKGNSKIAIDSDVLDVYISQEAHKYLYNSYSAQQIFKDGFKTAIKYLEDDKLDNIPTKIVEAEQMVSLAENAAMKVYENICDQIFHCSIYGIRTLAPKFDLSNIKCGTYNDILLSVEKLLTKGGFIVQTSMENGTFIVKW